MNLKQWAHPTLIPPLSIEPKRERHFAHLKIHFLVARKKKMRPPSRHAAFFSSLKQVEKRLASESSSSHSSNPSQNPLFSPPTTATDNLSSPIYLNYHQPNNTTTTNSLGLQESDPPQDFLSHSIEFPPTPQNPSQSHTPKCSQITNTSSDDEIAHLMELLGLSDGGEGRGDLIKGSSCFCNGGFYSKIAGVKGPKCEKERRRLEGWIGYFLNDGGGERREPLRLAHLLLAKAACLDVSGDDGFGGIEFPSTVEEFLNHDPPPLPPHQHN